MERLAELISKLKEQFEQNADHTQLLLTTHMIEDELMRSVASSKQVKSSSKIAVVMPAGRKHFQSEENHFQSGEESLGRPVRSAPAEFQPKPAPVHEEKTNWKFDPLREIPTLAHQESVREINEMIGSADASLNDKLKASVVEVGHKLTDSPIRDLKRAIGVNDRFVFINELFRGDEVMYERSIKTINNFRIFAEAEYWIERELKVKLGWEEVKPATKQFYQLVKRRFS
jgi:hypothetical protein